MLIKKCNVLVVDDEAGVRDSLAAFLEDSGYEVLTAESGEDALDLLVETPCQVAIVDLRLPGISGDEFILQAHQQYPSMKFLIHTGSVNFQIPRELHALGIRQNHVFLKPQNDLGCFVTSIEQLEAEQA